MGGFSSILGAVAPILSIAGVPGAIMGGAQQMISHQQSRDALRRQQDLFMQQLMEKQNQNLSDTATRTATESARLREESESTRVRRTAALRRAVARQKTLFSSQGIGSGGGSSEAVLLGLYDEAKNEQGVDDRIDALRQTALAQGVDSLRQRNVLEATQMSQQHNLARLLQGY